MRIRWISSQMESELPFVWLHTHDRLNTKQCAKCVCVWEHVANFDLIRWLFACIPHCLNKITMWSSSSNEQHLCNGQYISHRERARLTWNWIYLFIIYLNKQNVHLSKLLLKFLFRQLFFHLHPFRSVNWQNSFRSSIYFFFLDVRKSNVLAKEFLLFSEKTLHGKCFSVNGNGNCSSDVTDTVFAQYAAAAAIAIKQCACKHCFAPSYVVNGGYS